MARAVVTAVGELRKGYLPQLNARFRALRPKRPKTRESHSSIHWYPMVFMFFIIETAKGKEISVGVHPYLGIPHQRLI